MASNQVDTFGKILLKERPDYLYKYKGQVPIGVLGMIDDLAGVRESGVNAKQLNAYLNVKTAGKKLQFGPDKCHTLEITHKNVTCSQSDLYIDHWSENHGTEGNLNKQFEGQVKMVNVPEQKDLGYILSEDKSNMKNI
jgi:hypothetical protein